MEYLDFEILTNEFEIDWVYFYSVALFKALTTLN